MIIDKLDSNIDNFNKKINQLNGEYDKLKKELN